MIANWLESRSGRPESLVLAALIFCVVIGVCVQIGLSIQKGSLDAERDKIVALATKLSGQNAARGRAIDPEQADAFRAVSDQVSVTAPSQGQATALFHYHLKTRAEEAGVSVLSVEARQSEPMTGDVLRLKSRMRFGADSANLQSFLHAAEFGMPRLGVQSLTIEVPADRGTEIRFLAEAEFSVLWLPPEDGGAS